MASHTQRTLGEKKQIASISATVELTILHKQFFDFMVQIPQKTIFARNLCKKPPKY